MEDGPKQSFFRWEKVCMSYELWPAADNVLVQEKM